MSGRPHPLGELQLAVMNILWSRREATVHEVLDALPAEHRPAYTTVLTVLRSLEKRGKVTHDAMEGTRQYRYRPLVSAHDARDDILHDVLNRLFAGSPTMLVKHLLETEGFTLAELRELRKVIDTQEKEITG